MTAATAGVGSDNFDQDPRDLEARGLLNPMEEGSTMLWVSDDVRVLITPLGWKFVEFVSLVDSPEGGPIQAPEEP